MSLTVSDRIDRSVIKDFLPSCQRCRGLRRRCDTNLPICRRCAKAGASCSFYDDATGRVVERSYIDHLLSQIEKAESLSPNGVDSNLTETSIGLDDQEGLSNRKESNHQTDFSRTPFRTGSADIRAAYDVTFQYLPGSGHNARLPKGTLAFRHFGTSSVIVLLVGLLSYTRRTPYHTSMKRVQGSETFEHYTSESPTSSWVKLNDLFTPTVALMDMIPSLLSTFHTTFDVIYPVTTESAIQIDLNAYRHIIQRSDFKPRSLKGQEAYQYHRISLMCAIASFHKSRFSNRYSSLCNYFYHEAVQCLENVTLEISWDSLRAIILIALFYTTFPREGDMYRSADYAARISVDLECNSNSDDPMFLYETEALPRQTFWVVYTLEQTIAQMLGRPTAMQNSTVLDDMLLPSHAVQYRQLYSRSAMQTFHEIHQVRAAIFSVLQHPVTMNVLDPKWYGEQFNNLKQCCSDLDISSLSENIVTTHCILTYHSGVLMLFQPLLLHLLSQAKTNDGFTSYQRVWQQLLHHSHFSAVQLLGQYEQIINAPEDSALGHFPLTSIAANDIAVAAITLLCHALLFLASENDVARSEDQSHISKWNNIYCASATCLHLLTWCAQKWQGLSGALEIYKRTSATVLPAVTKKIILLT